MTQHRALEWLHLYGRRYPWAWESYAQLHAAAPAEWPPWCWMPLAGTYSVLSRGGHCTTDQAADIGPMGALAAWRCTQGIYRVHPTLLAELLDTPITGDLPAEVLTRLPEWCVYVETPGHCLWSLDLHGMWAYLEHDSHTGRAELRLVLDLAPAESNARLGQLVVHLGGSLEEGIRAAVREARIQALRAGHPELAPTMVEEWDVEGAVGGLISVLLYLCADDAEIEGRTERPPRVISGRKRPLMPAAKAPVIHPAGYRIGAALDLARERVRSESDAAVETGRRVAAHIRRAHWHRFWMGSRAGERRVALRWLSPILVNLDDAPTVATLHTVRDD